MITVDQIRAAKRKIQERRYGDFWRPEAGSEIMGRIVEMSQIEVKRNGRKDKSTVMRFLGVDGDVFTLNTHGSLMAGLEKEGLVYCVNADQVAKDETRSIKKIWQLVPHSGDKVLLIQYFGKTKEFHQYGVATLCKYDELQEDPEDQATDYNSEEGGPLL